MMDTFQIYFCLVEIGVGKTTVAKAMLEEIGATYMMINGSEESGIDVLRNKIKNFASTVSMDGNRKFVILDEADYLNPQSTQPALRGFIEEFHKNCGFILTCNFKNRIIEPLHSRCSVVEFRIPTTEKPALIGQFFKRVQDILKSEDVQFEPKLRWCRRETLPRLEKSSKRTTKIFCIWYD